MALLVATLVAWMVRDALPSTGAVPITTMLAFCVWIVIFPIAKRWFTEIRPE